MQSMLITAPIPTDKLTTWQRFITDLLESRRAGYEEAIAAGTLSRLRVWHQKGPGGSQMAVVLFEGTAPEQFLGRISSGADDFSAWFRDQLADCHGLDLSQPPPPPPENVIDVQIAVAQ